MKENTSLKLFCLILLAFYVSTQKGKAKKEVFQHYYYIQRLYPGLDPFESISPQNTIMNLYFVTLNRKMIYFTKNALDKNIEGKFS